MTEPGTLPEGIDQLIGQISVSLAEALFWPNNSNPEQRKLIEISLSAAYVQGAAQERARFTALVSHWRDAAVWEHDDMSNTQSAQAFDQCASELESALATRTPPPPEAQEPCSVCGNEERTAAGYLSCECPAPPPETQDDGEPAANEDGDFTHHG